MNKKTKPVDIINAAISEIYGHRAIELLFLFAKLNEKGQLVIIDRAFDCSNLPKYLRAIQFDGHIN